MSRTLYHSTSFATVRLIEDQGFRDASLFAGAIWGVCFSDRPLTAADGVARHADACFAVEVPGDLSLDEFEIIEEDRPPEAYREWVVPQDVANAWPRTRYYGDCDFLTEEEAADYERRVAEARRAWKESQKK